MSTAVTAAAADSPTPPLNSGAAVIDAQKPVPGAGDTASVRASRAESIDVIRLVAAAGIVFIHAAKTEPLISIGHAFRFAVPFYLFASLYFQSQSLRKNPNRTLGGYILSRFRRLYLPFLAWSVVYLIARDIVRVKVKHLPPVELEAGLLWKGVEYHLWFLPFLLMASIVLAVLYWAFLRQSRAWRWPLIIVAVAAGVVFAVAPMPAWDEVFPSPAYAYVQWWRSAPATCWALAFAWFMTMGATIYSVPALIGWGGVALALFCSIKQAVQHEIQLIPRALSGFGCIVAALMPWPKNRAVSLLAHFGRYSYGIYLCHVLVVEVVRIIESRCHFVPSVTTDLATFILGFSGSLALVCALGRSRYSAWLNG
jgi:peptidoglycan/LPS O-acetylase OafA/YrhL